ncbi:MAG: hypothetical protein LBP59_06205 [Planctomycetaceae bacterium]|nr:hypothetical protein [Planctomycetaceae bacterium]
MSDVDVSTIFLFTLRQLAAATVAFLYFLLQKLPIRNLPNKIIWNVMINLYITIKNRAVEKYLIRIILFVLEIH